MATNLVQGLIKNNAALTEKVDALKAELSYTRDRLLMSEAGRLAAEGINTMHDKAAKVGSAGREFAQTATATATATASKLGIFNKPIETTLQGQVDDSQQQQVEVNNP